MILEICIEKRKGLLLGKLWNLQLIKRDLQIIMRIFLSIDEEELIEKDPGKLQIKEELFDRNSNSREKNNIWS